MRRAGDAPGVRRYADLLLTAASRHGLASRLLAAHFGEYTSDLVRRIEAMTSRTNIPWRRIAAASFLATALGAAACETPRPDPVAPLPARTPVASAQEVAVQSERCRVHQRAPAALRGGPVVDRGIFSRRGRAGALRRSDSVLTSPESGVASPVRKAPVARTRALGSGITLKPGDRAEDSTVLDMSRLCSQLSIWQNQDCRTTSRATVVEVRTDERATRSSRRLNCGRNLSARTSKDGEEIREVTRGLLASAGHAAQRWRPADPPNVLIFCERGSCGDLRARSRGPRTRSARSPR